MLAGWFSTNLTDNDFRGPANVTHPTLELLLANVAQLVEQLICNQLVGGSSPSIGSKGGQSVSLMKLGPLVQDRDRGLWTRRESKAAYHQESHLG